MGHLVDRWVLGQGQLESALGRARMLAVALEVVSAGRQAETRHGQQGALVRVLREAARRRGEWSPRGARARQRRAGYLPGQEPAEGPTRRRQAQQELQGQQVVGHGGEFQGAEVSKHRAYGLVAT